MRLVIDLEKLMRKECWDGVARTVIRDLRLAGWTNIAEDLTTQLPPTYEELAEAVKAYDSVSLANYDERDAAVRRLRELAKRCK